MKTKFRAWDDNGEQSRMYYPGDKTYDGTVFILNMYGDVLEARKLHEGEVNRTTDEAYNHAVYPARIGHNLTLMQYIGLNDHHGQEIYDGDILKNIYPIEYGHRIPAGDIWKVEFAITGGCAGFWLYNVCLDTIPFDRTEIGRLVFNDDEGSDNFAVIGNIYENPELLR